MLAIERLYYEIRPALQNVELVVVSHDIDFDEGGRREHVSRVSFKHVWADFMHTARGRWVKYVAENAASVLKQKDPVKAFLTLVYEDYDYPVQCFTAREYQKRAITYRLTVGENRL